MNKFDVILADPPWQYKAHKGDKGSRTAESFYSTLTTQQISSLSISSITAPNAALFLWVTAPCLPEGLEVMKAWGFKFKTIAFSWIKLNPKNKQVFFGLGHYTRGNNELVLLGIKGRMPVADRSVSQVIMTPRGAHSQKPLEVHRAIERLYPNTSKLELFARTKQPGWSVLGDQIDGIDIRTSLSFLTK